MLQIEGARSRAFSALMTICVQVPSNRRIAGRGQFRSRIRGGFLPSHFKALLNSFAPQQMSGYENYSTTRKSHNRQERGGHSPEKKMIRDTLANSLKEALKAKDVRRTSTVRLIQTAIKDRDIAHRGAGKDPVSDDEIMQILMKMIKQRDESAKIYAENDRPELAAQEREEIAIIKTFMPEQLSEEKVRELCAAVINETGAQGLRDMGKCISALKERYAGQMDFGKASGVVKDLLK